MESPLPSGKEPSLWPLAFLGSAIALLSFLKPVQNTAQSVHPNQTPTEKCNQVDSSILTNVPPSIAKCNYPNGGEDRTPTWKKAVELIVAISTLGLLVVNIFLMFSTKHSVEISEKALRSASAGIIRPELGLSRDTINVVFHNIGKGSVREVDARYKITWESIPDEKSIWVSDWKSYNSAVDQAGEGRPNETVIPRFRIPDDWNNYIHSQNAIKVDGIVQYNDGFDNIPPHPFCIMTSGGGMFQCDGLEAYLRSLPPQH